MQQFSYKAKNVIQKGKALVWFKQTDLRLLDHEPLYQAHSLHENVEHIFIFDPRFLTKKSDNYGFLKASATKTKFILEAVQDLHQQLKSKGCNLMTQIGKPEEIIPKLVEQYQIQTLYIHDEICYEELQIQEALEKNCKCQIMKYMGNSLFDQLPFKIQDMPMVFTPFKNAFLKRTGDYPVRQELYNVDTYRKGYYVDDHLNQNVPQLRDLGYEEPTQLTNKSISAFPWVGGETSALNRVKAFFWDKKLIQNYKDVRNGMLGPDYSSKLSAFLSTGCVSPVYIFKELLKYESKFGANDSTDHFAMELLWREFFRYLALKEGSRIFYVQGILQNKDIDKQLAQDINYWKLQAQEFKSNVQSPSKEQFNQKLTQWINGQTGYPIVDANMRELKATGWMSNRGRQIVASFLIKDLLIDWRAGAEYFEEQLLDHDPMSNYGNWAYIGGVGVDPRKNRYFNVVKQAGLYDPDGKYMRAWVPELSQAHSEFLVDPISNPHLKPNVGYPSPMVKVQGKVESFRVYDSQKGQKHGNVPGKNKYKR